MCSPLRLHTYPSLSAGIETDQDSGKCQFTGRILNDGESRDPMNFLAMINPRRRSRDEVQSGSRLLFKPASNASDHLSMSATVQQRFKQIKSSNPVKNGPCRPAPLNDCVLFRSQNMHIHKLHTTWNHSCDHRGVEDN